MQGYGGRLLFVDCATGATRIEPLAERTARALLGGNGLAARVLYDHVPAGIDAFDPANAVVFAVGPVTDTTVPGNSRACVAAKSPLTGLFFDSTFGGRFPATLKRTGFDAVVLTGRAPAPSYVSVDEHGAQLKPAAHLWGRSTREAVNALLEVEGGDADAIAIGPAGEQRVRFAAMAHYWKNREGVSGRGGIGAVLGSKNVKARGGAGRAQDRDRRSGCAQGAARGDARAAEAPARRRCPPSARRSSSARSTRWARSAATTSRARSSPRRSAVGGESMKEHYHDRDTTCLKCPVACGKQYAISEGEFAGTRAKMPEYESIFALGPMLGIANPEALILANDLCDLLGMDTISMGVTLAFVCEALERGWLTPSDVGVPFGWGDWRGMLKLVEMTARREGFGASPGRGRLAAGRVRSSRRRRASSTRSSAWSCPRTRRARSRACRSATRRPRAAAATTTRGPRRSTRRPSTGGARPTSPPSPRAASTSPPSAIRSSCVASPPSAASACSWASRTPRWSGPSPAGT